MKVKDQIEVLQNAIDQLKQLDQDALVIGHIPHPDGCYSGDMSGEIYKIKPVVETVHKNVYLSTYYR